MRHHISAGFFVLLTHLANCQHTFANDRYFMVVLASEARPRLPKLCHTFATFIKLSETDNSESHKMEIKTISWLPASLDIRPLRLRPELGTNLDLKASLEFAKRQNAMVVGWGPLPIKKELYDRAVKQIDWLNAGRMSFVVLDRRFRGQGASNCMHAVSDIDVDQGFLNTGLAYGVPASQKVFNHLRRWAVPSQEDFGPLLNLLDLPRNFERMDQAAIPATR